MMEQGPIAFLLLILLFKVIDHQYILSKLKRDISIHTKLERDLLQGITLSKLFIKGWKSRTDLLQRVKAIILTYMFILNINELF